MRKVKCVIDPNFVSSIALTLDKVYDVIEHDINSNGEDVYYITDDNDTRISIKFPNRYFKDVTQQYRSNVINDILM